MIVNPELLEALHYSAAFSDGVGSCTFTATLPPAGSQVGATAAAGFVLRGFVGFCYTVGAFCCCEQGMLLNRFLPVVLID
jgi:hypothetical protein